MPELDLASIKRESVGMIFNILENGRPMTRSELASATGLSLMTVGKAVDLLTDSKLAVQQKVQTGSAGRRSLSCMLNPGLCMLVYDIEKLSFSSVDILTNIKSKYSASRENVENVAAEAFFDAANGSELIGFGLILPDSSPEVAAREFSALNSMRPDAAIPRTKAAALAAADSESISVLIRLADDLSLLSGAVTVNGNILGGLYSRTDFARLKTPEAAISAAEALIAPDKIRLWTTPDAVGRLKARLPDSTASQPEILTDPDLPARGIAKLLISKRLDSICR